MKALLIFLAGCFSIAALHAQNPGAGKSRQDGETGKDATQEYVKGQITRVECDVSGGTLVITIGEERLTYIPLAEPRVPGRNVLPPLNTNRHERVMECLALQKAIREGQGIRIMRWNGNKEVILALTLIDVLH